MTYAEIRKNKVVSVYNQNVFHINTNTGTVLLFVFLVWKRK